MIHLVCSAGIQTHDLFLAHRSSLILTTTYNRVSDLRFTTILQQINVQHFHRVSRAACLGVFSNPNDSIFINGPFPASFFFIFVFSLQLTVNKCLLPMLKFELQALPHDSIFLIYYFNAFDVTHTHYHYYYIKSSKFFIITPLIFLSRTSQRFQNYAKQTLAKVLHIKWVCVCV